MFKLLLISIVIVPVLLGVHAAKIQRGPRGLLLAVVFVLAYDFLYLLMLYYLRVRWAA